jgi:hypothetical protein
MRAIARAEREEAAWNAVGRVTMARDVLPLASRLHLVHCLTHRPHCAPSPTHPPPPSFIIKIESDEDND